MRLSKLGSSVDIKTRRHFLPNPDMYPDLARIFVTNRDFRDLKIPIKGILLNLVDMVEKPLNLATLNRYI